jgi:hypothetical protein
MAFVTPTEVRQNTTLTHNVDENDITPIIAAIETQWIEPILGTYFMDYLDALTNPSANETKLIAKIKPAIWWGVTSELTISLSYRLVNKGLQKQSGEFSEPLEVQEVGFVAKEYSKKRDVFLSRLVDYLKANKNLFPQFLSDNNNDSDVKKSLENDFLTSGFTII